ncbi:MAG: metallophosphoesterase [Caldilineae bacterium]|nr:MAG: metallophosphoesterase [Caldilineae bacterium]
MALSSSKRRSRYRVLAVSDKVEPRIYGPHIRHIVGDIHFIASCGDLPYYYLDYIVSSLDVPFFYVHGNHDRPEHRADKSILYEPRGGVNLHKTIRHFDGLLLAGLEGSHRYNNNPRYQYTQSEMWMLALSLIPGLLLNRIVYGRYLDVLITHSPPYGIHDGRDRPHIGFRALLALMRWFRPSYLLHGHQHVYSTKEITQTRYFDTEIINVYPYRILDLVFSEP